MGGVVAVFLAEAQVVRVLNLSVESGLFTFIIYPLTIDFRDLCSNIIKLKIISKTNKKKPIYFAVNPV